MIIMFCSKCGKEIDDTSKFCNYCGNKILTENDNTKPIKQHKKAIIFLIIGLLALCIIGIFIFQILSKPKIIELNKDNFQDYIIFNLSLDDFEIENGSGLYAWFKGTAKLNVSAKLKKDVEVDNVVINGRIHLNGLCWAGNNYTFTLELDKNGEAEISKEITTGEAGILKPDEPILLSSEYYLQDGEFILENAYLEVSGNIIE